MIFILSLTVLKQLRESEDWEVMCRGDSVWKPCPFAWGGEGTPYPVCAMLVLPLRTTDLLDFFQRAPAAGSSMSFSGSQGTDDSLGHRAVGGSLDSNQGFSQSLFPVLLAITSFVEIATVSVMPETL